MQALRGLAILLLLQAAGEALVRLFGLPFPGPVIGMLLLLVAVNVELIRTPVQAAAELLLAHLSLLFVPVGVGAITHLSVISQYGGRLAVVIVVSTLAGLAVTALVARALMPREDARPVIESKEAPHG
jgi:holin-like protein